jgi:multiple sugar transport system substrate-binding protein
MGLPEFGQAAAKAMQYYADLYKIAPPEALTWGHEEETSAICTGLCAMDATSNVELAAYLLGPECEHGDAIKFAYPPVGKSGIGSPDMGGYGLLVSAHSRNIKDASAFALWAADKKIHRLIVLQGGSPIRKSELKDPDILAKFPYLRFYEILIRDSVYRARIPQWPELEDIISRELVAVMKGEKSAEAAARIVQEWIIKEIQFKQ